MICQDGITRRKAPLFVVSEVYRRAAYGRNHPLAIPRIETAVDLCRSLGWLDEGVYESPIASFSELTRFHTPSYVSALREADRAGFVPAEVRERYNIGTMENPIFSGVFERATTSVGGSIIAAKFALEGRIVYHPAGGTHHAKSDRASGFCFFNDPVFAILTLLDAGLSRVLYVDLDAHHGDGVENAFADDPRVFTISIHEAGRWPHSGARDDRRAGYARNLPVPAAINDEEFVVLIEEAVVPLARRFAPDAVIVTCGADPLKGDPLSSMALSNGALWYAAMRVAASAEVAVVLGGGGYNPWTVGRFWAGLWGCIAGKPIPAILPVAARAILKQLSCDLIDDEDIDPVWLNSLVDPPNSGPVRDEIISLVHGALAP